MSNLRDIRVPDTVAVKEDACPECGRDVLHEVSHDDEWGGRRQSTCRVLCPGCGFFELAMALRKVPKAGSEGGGG